MCLFRVNKVAGSVLEHVLTNAFWFVSGSLACRNLGHSGHRKSPVEWAAAVATQTTRFYACLSRQQPKVQKPINLNGTVGQRQPVKSQSQDALTWSQIGPFMCVFCFIFFPPQKLSSSEEFFKAFILSRQAIIHALHVLVYQHCQLSFKFITFQTMSLQIQCEIGKWK